MRILYFPVSKISIQNMMLSSLGLLGFSKKKKNNHEAIENSLQQIVPYLEEEDYLSLKLTCRPFYYWFITSEIWVGLKMGVAEEKIQYYDDFEFEESEPKQISKKDKNIRIHSLKKQSQNKLPQREASNIKQKSKAIVTNNQLLFRNTQIGFKRLLKTNNSQRPIHLTKNLSSSEDIFSVGDPEAYIIRLNEPWSVNMKKVQNLIGIVKRFNQFHHKFTTHLKSPCKEMRYLFIRLKEAQEKIKQYKTKTQSEPLYSIIQSTEGANQNLLIDQQLNKVCKLFWSYHVPMIDLSNEVDPLIQFCQSQQPKLDSIKNMQQISSIEYLENVSGIQELVNGFSFLIQKNPTICKNFASNFINIYVTSIETMESLEIYFQEKEVLTLRNIQWRNLVRHSFFFETLFQIMNGLCSKIVKLLLTHCGEDLTMAITATKMKNVKSVSQSLVNVSKYFGKLRKQFQEKKSKSKAETIRDFLDSYEAKEGDNLYQVKNPVKLEKWIGELKDRIGVLKNKMQTQ